MAAKPCLYLAYSYLLFPLPPHLSFPFFLANVGRLHYASLVERGRTNAALREQAHTTKVPLTVWNICGQYYYNYY